MVEVGGGFLAIGGSREWCRSWLETNMRVFIYPHMVCMLAESSWAHVPLKDFISVVRLS